MAFPRKFKELLELELEDIESPGYMWVTYAVCGTEQDSCGWGGWMIEAAFKNDGKTHPTGTGDKLVSAVDEQRCPNCGKQTARTGATLRFEPSEDQTPVRAEGVDYELIPTEYED